MNDLTSGLNYSMGLSSLISIVVTIVMIGLAWWALQQVRFDLFLKQPGSPASKMLQVLLAIALGYEIARFVLEYFRWSSLLKGLF